jgi:hypothetical protein
VLGLADDGTDVEFALAQFLALLAGVEHGSVDGAACDDEYGPDPARRTGSRGIGVFIERPFQPTLDAVDERPAHVT